MLVDPCLTELRRQETLRKALCHLMSEPLLYVLAVELR